MPQASSSSDSLDGPCVDYAKSYDAVVFDVLKVTPEEFAVSTILNVMFYAAYTMDQLSPKVYYSIRLLSGKDLTHAKEREVEVWSMRYQHHLKELYQR